MDNLNREFHELIGKCWHEDEDTYAIMGFNNGFMYKCMNCGRITNVSGWTNPDYAADARLVLREMMEREDFELFVIGLNDGDLTRWLSCPIRLILDNTGLLLRKAVEWLRRDKT